MAWWAWALLGLYFLFRGKPPKKKRESPTYTFPEWKPTSSRENPLPIIYGNNKVTGNWIWRTPTESSVIYGALGIGEGEIESISDVRIDGKDITSLASCETKPYLGTPTQEKDPGTTYETVFKSKPTDDADVNTYSPNETEAFPENITVMHESDGEFQVYLKFDISSLPASAVITSAKLKLYGYSGSQNYPDGHAYLKKVNDDSWNEEEITWNNKPSMGETISYFYFPGGTEKWYEFDVKDYLVSKLGSTYISFGICKDYKHNGFCPYISFHSKEHGTSHPVLEIKYTYSEGGGEFAFRNTAYLALKLTASDQLENVSENDISCIVQGLKIKNWSGTEWQVSFSNNPAWEILDLMINDRYGAGIPESLIDLESFKAVAAYCDEKITNADGKKEKRFISDIVIDEKTSAQDAINDILASFGGYYYFVDGKIHLGVETAGSPIYSFTEDNIIEGSFSYSQVEEAKIPNEVRVLFTDATKDFNKSYAIAKDEIDQEKRGKVVEEIPLYAINRYSQASRMANFYLWKGKLIRYTCSFKVGIEASHLCVGDIVEVTHPLPGWSQKPFRIIEIRESSVDELELVCEEYNASLYKDEGLPYLPSEESTLPNVNEVPPVVTDLTLSEVSKVLDDGTYVPQIKVTFTKPDYIFGLRFLIWVKKTAEGSYYLANTTSNNECLIDVEGGGVLYYVRVQTENIQTGIRSVFSSSPTDSITIAGKESPPSNVTFIDGKCHFYRDVYLEWNRITDKDLAFYEVRTDTNWGNPTNLVFQGKDTNFTLLNPASTSYTFYIKARDNSGNYSATADSITVTNTAPTMPTPSVDFTGRDCVVTWTAVTDPDFEKYEIKVYSDAGRTILKRTEETQSPHYIYTFEKNKIDNGTPIRDVYFTITAYDSLGQSDSKNCSGSNAVPSTPSMPSLTPFFSKLWIKWTLINEPDIIGYNVYVDESSPASTKVAFVANDNFVYEAEPGKTYYVRISAVDAFGEGAKSSEASETTLSLQLKDYNLDLPLTSGITWSTDSKVIWTSGTLTYKGAVYNITGGNTTDEYIWWDKNNSPTTFHHSNTRPSIGADIWLMAYYDSETDTVYPAFQNKIMHAGLLQASTITADLIGTNEIITSSANIKDGVIENAKIADATIDIAKLNEVTANHINLSYTIAYNSRKLRYWDGESSTWDSIDKSWEDYGAESSGQIDLDNIVDGTYGKVLSTDITAGHIKLSACIGSLDDIPNGSTYGKVALTDISAGHILLGKIVDSDGYSKDNWQNAYTLADAIRKYGSWTEIDGSTITTGKIRSADGKTYFDLDNSEFYCNRDGGFKIDASEGVQLSLGAGIKMAFGVGNWASLKFKEENSDIGYEIYGYQAILDSTDYMSFDLTKVGSTGAFRKISLIADMITVEPALRLDTLYDVAPTIPSFWRDGVIAYADGIHWNPGDGKGFYGYYDGAWHKLG